MKTVKGLIVISVDLPYPTAVVDIIHHLDPASVPYFSGEIRVVVGTDVDETIQFLDEG